MGDVAGDVDVAINEDDDLGKLIDVVIVAGGEGDIAGDIEVALAVVDAGAGAIGPTGATDGVAGVGGALILEVSVQTGAEGGAGLDAGATEVSGVVGDGERGVVVDVLVARAKGEGGAGGEAIDGATDDVEIFGPGAVESDVVTGEIAHISGDMARRDGSLDAAVGEDAIVPGGHGGFFGDGATSGIIDIPIVAAGITLPALLGSIVPVFVAVAKAITILVANVIWDRDIKGWRASGVMVSHCITITG